MSPVLDTTFIRPQDREEAIRNEVWTSMFAMTRDVECVAVLEPTVKGF